MKLASITKTGTSGSVTVSDALFGATVNTVLLAQAIRVYQANARQGTSKVKTRSEVSLTKKKWYKQKGTGNARHGSKNAPIFVGGGVAHGPSGLENWDLSLSRKMKNSALISALSAQADRIVVSDALSTLSGKTKEAATVLASLLQANKRILVVVGERNELVERALANIAQVSITTAALLNAYDVAAANAIVLDSAAIAQLEARLLPAKKEVVAPKKAVAKKRKAAQKSE